MGLVGGAYFHPFQALIRDLSTGCCCTTGTMVVTGPPGQSPTWWHLLSYGRVAGWLVHFLPFWEVIQADHWVLEIICQGYSIELVQTPQFQGVMSTQVPLDGPEVPFNEVEDLLRKGAIVPTPRPGEEWVLQHLFPGTPK